MCLRDRTTAPLTRMSHLWRSRWRRLAAAPWAVRAAFPTIFEKPAVSAQLYIGSDECAVNVNKTLLSVLKEARKRQANHVQIVWASEMEALYGK